MDQPSFSSNQASPDEADRPGSIDGRSRAPLVDPFGRRIEYVRLSVTDRCNFRCLYCMPKSIEALAKARLLSFDEIERIATVLAQLGVRKLRLTGGEPTVRRGLPELVARLARVPGLVDLGMTTNGWNLATCAPALRAAGLSRVNVSLDTLRRERFLRLAQVDRLNDVLAGIEAVVALGWTPLKLNVVVCRGVNDDEAPDFVERFAALPISIRFIEYMEFGAPGFSLVPWDTVRRTLDRRFRLEPVPGRPGDGPARSWKVEGTDVTVGAISARSDQFCAGCNRIRIGADGSIRSCLAYEGGAIQLRDVLRAGGDDDDIEAALRAAVLRKPWSHTQGEQGGRAFEGEMVRCGG